LNALWSYFWPAFAIGLTLGLALGLVAMIRRRRWIIAAAALLALGGAALWHGPLGGAGRFSKRVESDVAATLTYDEMTQVKAHLQHGPLTRRVVMQGPADDFQRSELARLMGQIPGVSSAGWTRSAGVPLIAEGLLVAALGFLVGLLLAYLIDARRRYNAEWTW
jgi:hypothetical protein